MASVTDTAKAEPPVLIEAAPIERRRAGARARRRAPFSKLVLRILAVNLVAVGIVAGGVLYLDQYQRALIEERMDALAGQGTIVAAALGEIVIPADSSVPQTMDPFMARVLLQRLIDPTEIRARLYNWRGGLIVDSRMLAVGGAQVRLEILPPPDLPDPFEPWLDAIHDWFARQLTRDLPIYLEAAGQSGRDYEEVMRALAGEIAGARRRTSDGRAILSMAVPVQRFKQVVGVLLLSTGTEDMEMRVRAVRDDILWLSLGAFTVTALLSLYLAGTIARPIRHLAAGAERLTMGSGHAEIPDLSRRGDEIGDLSVALRAMTEALRQRIDEIESFAADVAHELKNPLSSLRSAVETLNRVDDKDAQAKLLDLVVQDVRRMDRLITDISAASRLDAELARSEAEAVELKPLLETLVKLHQDMRAEDGPILELIVAPPGRPLVVRGLPGRLGLVFRNLIDNAISFSPPGGRITITLARAGAEALVTVEDSGPGIPPGKIEAIFERFYSERPRGEAFGTHSGLGLSIARKIVAAHGGAISAENRIGADGAIHGARFVVRLRLAR